MFCTLQRVFRKYQNCVYYDGQYDEHPFSDCALLVECFICCCRVCGHYMLMVAFVF